MFMRVYRAFRAVGRMDIAEAVLKIPVNYVESVNLISGTHSTRIF
jgi:hypothetical protein